MKHECETCGDDEAVRLTRFKNDRPAFLCGECRELVEERHPEALAD